jgi:hypothetical protein
MSDVLPKVLESIDPLVLRQERDRALEDAAKWRRRYETEAQQRRAEAEKADRTICDLRAELLQLCQLGPTARPSGQIQASSYDPTNGLDRLKLELAKLQQERNELMTALTQEQQQHAKTRENLISALSEALQRKKS